MGPRGYTDSANLCGDPNKNRSYVVEVRGVRRTARFGRARLTTGVRSVELRKRTFTAGLSMCALVVMASPAVAGPEPTPTATDSNSVTPDPSTAKAAPTETPTPTATEPEPEPEPETETPAPTP